MPGRNATLHRGLTHIFQEASALWTAHHGGSTFSVDRFLADKTGKYIAFRNDDSNAPDPGMTAHLSNYH
jgi:hypothetical protein